MAVSEQKVKQSQSEICLSNKHSWLTINTLKHAFNTIMKTFTDHNLCADLNGNFDRTDSFILNILWSHFHTFTKCDNASEQNSSANDSSIISDLNERTHSILKELFFSRDNTISSKEVRNQIGVAEQVYYQKLRTLQTS